ncbi:MAG: HlyD family efflux transporter periplasmic adaptor subunit [Candidatus Kapabacteria bacterium]|jgi:membrane fusion protein (multidrug efflux system)|nr:HlyD family efflux transporter periplasmic adaptor subunit [Candidatus Kapabacteria bacterium]
MLRKVLVSASFIIVILALGFVMKYVFAGMKPDDVPKKDAFATISVNAAKIKYGDLQSSLSESGRLTSREIVNLTPEVQGKILAGNVALKKGQSFRRGDLLVKIFDDDALLRLQAQKSRFLNLIANLLPDFKVDFKDSYDEWTKFFGDIKLDKNIPEIPEIKSDREKIYLASRNVLSEYFNIKSQEVTMRKYKLYAPFNGAYRDVILEVGAVAGPGGRIASMIRTDRLELEIPVKKADAKMLRKGASVSVTDDKGDSFTGRINRISNFMNPKTQSVTVYISLAGANASSLYNGAYLTAQFASIEVKNAMEIPRAAVFNHNHVFVVIDGKLVKESINILKVNEKTLLFNGLEEGTDIVVESLINVKENTVAEIIK